MKVMKALRIGALPLAAALAAIAPTPAAQESPRGVYVSDIDRSANPCADFFQYANGAWRAAHPIPESMTRWSRRWEAGETAKDRLKTILDEISAKKDWPKGSIERQLADDYGACMDQEAVDGLGIKPIQPVLSAIDAMKGPADVQAMIVRLHGMALFVPFGLVSNPDNHEPTRVIATVFASGLGLPDRDYYLKPEDRFKEAREKYLAHVEAIFALAGYGKEKAAAAAATVFAFERKLAEASLDNVALRDPQATDHPTRFEDLKKMTPHVDWDGYFAAGALAKADLNVTEPKFLEEIDRRLVDSPLTEWKTYLAWQVLHAAAPDLSSPFVDENYAFYGKYLSGAAEIKPRWKRCVESVDGNLGEALGRKYVERYFPPAAKARMQEMVKNLLAAMKETIDGLTWMGPETKRKALQKLATFNPKIGYPDQWKDYSSVAVAPGTRWSNLVAEREFAVRDDRAQIGRPVDRGRWGMTPPTSDAYYNPLLNEIVFPAGILQPPAFDMNAVDAVNYGAIGVVIGHEISHGFDDQGAQFDAEGRLQNWWSPEDLKNFQARTQCVVDQYEGYFIEPKIHHNGRLVVGESIGDLAGAKIAYLGWQISLRGKPPAPTIDGFTPAQQFFIAWGQFRGDEIRPETQRMMVQGDPHPIARYRVIGPVSNLPSFQEAFGCKDGSAMVRPEGVRCEVW